MKRLASAGRAGLVAVAAFAGTQAYAGCLSYWLPPVPDADSKPLKLELRIDVTKKWTGKDVSLPMAESFIETVFVDQANSPQYDGCNRSQTIMARIAFGTTELTADVSRHAGTVVPPSDAVAELTYQDTGFVAEDLASGASVWRNMYSSGFRLEATYSGPIWNEGQGRYTYATHSRKVSRFEFGLEGYFGAGAGLESYLLSRIGSGSFRFEDIVSIQSADYLSLDKYGYEGTATLLSVTSMVPEPDAAALMLGGLGWLIHVGQKRRVRRG